MDRAEREQRRQEITEKIRTEQARLGHESPLPAFLGVLTDYMIDTDARLDRLEARISRMGNSEEIDG